MLYCMHITQAGMGMHFTLHAHEAGRKACGHVHISPLSNAACRPDRRFSALAAICSNIVQLLGDQNISAAAAATYLGGVGTDPTFLPFRTLFKRDLLISDWYNTSHGSGELNLNQAPYGFFHSELPGGCMHLNC